MGCIISQVAAKFAFFPPTPPTYQLKKSEEDDDKLVAVSTTSSSSALNNSNSMDVLSIRTKRGNKIVAFYLKNPYARLTMLYSHGNAADLGHLFHLFLQLKDTLRVNLIGYDYSGYGASTGKASEYETYADIEAVYECLQSEYGVSQEDLILYGQSVGSGPTLHLAAKLPRLRAVVMHSAILSGLRVLCHLHFNFCCDIYKNVNKIQKVKCPVLVIHGTDDDVVNWLHGKGLWKLAREPYEPLWIKGGEHCNLELYPEYITHLSTFVREMENITTATRLQKIRQTLHLHKTSSKCASASKCCTKIHFRTPKCKECSSPCCCWWPKCPKWRPKWPICRSNCLACFGCGCMRCSFPICRSNCLACFGCGCMRCSFWVKKCSCRRTMCSCLYTAKCPCC